MFDIYDDRGELLKEYFPTLDSMPDWVRRGLGKFSTREKLSLDEFAVCIPTVSGMKGIYPINNDAMTAVSCLYFEQNGGLLPEKIQKIAATRLWEACQEFGVECPSERVASLVATGYQEQKKAAPAPASNKGAKTAGDLLPLNTSAQVKTASELFDTVIRKLHPRQRRDFSRNLIGKTASFGLRAPAQAHKWGGNSVSRDAVMEAIEKRSSYMTEDQVQLLRRAADKILSMEPEKVAELLASIDEAAGLDVLWDKGIPDPYAIHYTKFKPNYVKVAGFEIPAEHWEAACDHGVLANLDPAIQKALRSNPELLNQYEGSPVMEYVVEGLKSLGMIRDGS